MADHPGRGQRPVYFSAGRALKFFVNPGGGIVMPSMTNPADAKADVPWKFCELTWTTMACTRILVSLISCRSR